MKRKTKTLMAFIIAIVFCMNSAVIASAEGETSGNCGDGVNWNYDAGTSTLTIEGSGRMDDYPTGLSPWYQYKYEIKNIIVSSGVTYIGELAFYQIHSGGSSYTVSVTLSEGLEEIGAQAFNKCGVETLNLPASLKTLQNQALIVLSDLKTITVSSGNTEFAVYDGGLYTSDFSKLLLYPAAADVKTHSIKTGCTEIGNYAFQNSSATSVTIPSTVTAIGQSAFTASSIQNIEIPSSVKSIGEKAFMNMSPVSNIYLFTYDCTFPSDAGSTYYTFYNKTEPPNVCFVYSAKTEEYLKSVGHTNYTILCKDGTENHTFEKTSTTATCTQAGTATMTCSVCGTTKEEDEEALGHSFANYISDGNATCTADGTKTAECDNGCGETDTVTDEGSMTEHIYEETVIAPTCTEQGYTEYKCKDCGNTYKSDYIDALGHTPETVIVKEAQIGIAGLQQEKCSVCGEVLSETEIPALKEEATESTTEEATAVIPATEIKEEDNSFNTDYSLFRVVSGIECAKAAVRFDEEISGYEVFISDGSGFKNRGEINDKTENYLVLLNLKSDCNYRFKLKAYKINDGKKIYADEESRSISVRIK